MKSSADLTILLMNS